MIELNPIFLISGTASGVVAPPHATVVSRRAKLVTPGTGDLVTCAAATPAPTNVARTSKDEIFSIMGELLERPIIVQGERGTPVLWTRPSRTVRPGPLGPGPRVTSASGGDSLAERLSCGLARR